MIPPPQSQSSQRFQFIDLLRGWAVFVMIETHIVNALLRSDVREYASFKVLTFFNGLVAPSFLFCAGVGLAITLYRKWQSYINFRRSLWNYVIRVLFILVVGYSLHLPFFSLKRLSVITDDRLWISFFQADILQTIVITLLIILIIAVISRSQSIFIYSLSVLSMFIVFASPIIRGMDHASLPIWFRPYLTTDFNSQFPLFPWSAFLTSGVIIGFLYMRVAGNWREQIRLGLVLLAFFVLWRYEQKGKSSENSLFIIFGQESLLVYVVHLLIVYGHTYKWSFIMYFGANLNYIECLGLFAVLALAMYIMAYVWHGLKKWNLRTAKSVQFITLALIVVSFILRES
ncbi:MAG: DUF1624 domain-containing protein [Ignavibacteriales bacterium]|nr:DUF1624 domain-containing protein [Ignavibacteriales bacterium]